MAKAALKSRSAKAIVASPVKWFRCVLEEHIALPVMFPDKCPNCGISFVNGKHLEEMSCTFHYQMMNKSMALGQDENMGDSAYAAEMYPMGYRCGECETLVVGNDTVE